MTAKAKEKKAQMHMSVFKTDREEFKRLRLEYDLTHRQLFGQMIEAFKITREHENHNSR